MSSCKWIKNKLWYFKNNGKSCLIAKFKKQVFSSLEVHLEAFYSGSIGFVGFGKSITLDVECETYLSRVDKTTYLIHYDPKSGRTYVLPDGVKNGVETKRRYIGDKK